MTVLTRVSGSWKVVNNLWTKVGGSWKVVARAYTKVSGTWKLAYSAMTLTLSTSAVTVHTSGGFVGCTVGSPNATDSPNVVGTVAGGTAPITLSLASVSGLVPDEINPASVDYTAGFSCNAVFQSPASGSCVLAATATDANGIAVTKNITVTVISP